MPVLSALQKVALAMALRLLAFVGEYAREMIRAFVIHAKAERADDPSLAQVIKDVVADANRRRANEPGVEWHHLFKDASDRVMWWVGNAGKDYSRAFVNSLLSNEVLNDRLPVTPETGGNP